MSNDLLDALTTKNAGQVGRILAGVNDLTGEDILQQPFASELLPAYLIADVSADSYRCVGDWVRIGDGIVQRISDPNQFVTSVGLFVRDYISGKEEAALDNIQFWVFGHRVRTAVDTRNEAGLKRLLGSMLKGLHATLESCDCMACDVFFGSACEWKLIRRDLLELGESEAAHCRSCMEAMDFAEDSSIVTAFARFLLRRREYCSSITGAAFSCQKVKGYGGKIE